MSTNPLIAQYLASQQAQAPLATNIAMPNSAPALSAPIAPNVVQAPPPPPTQTQLDTTELNRRINTGAGVDQIQNPLLKGIAKTADVLGSVFAPNLAQFIPGTTLHHNMLVNQQSNNVQRDQQEDESTAQQADQAAQATQRAALADKALKDKFSPIQTDSGYAAFDPATGKASPVLGPDGTQIGTPSKSVKEATPEQAVYDSQIAAGKSPLDAFAAVKQAGDTKQASLQQQFLDGYKKAHPEASDTDAIAATIRATSTEPKLTVINAAAADRAAAKTAGLDTSDPAMQASVAAVANGSMKLADVFGRGATTAQKAQFAAAVKAVNPAYNSGDHDIENSVRKYMTSGQGGSTLAAGTTLNHHLDLYDKAVDAVHNGDSKALNAIGNTLNIQMGNDAQTNLALIRQGVAMEAARFWTGGVPGEAEINQFNQNLSGDGSPKQMHGGANTVRFMAKGKLQGLQGQSEAGSIGQPNFAGAAGAQGGTPTATHTFNAKTGKIEAIQ